MSKNLIREISIALGMSEEDIVKIVATAPNRCKIYQIPKRSGEGLRTIAQPARELKNLQRFLVSKKLRGLKIHPIATAYRVGKNIGDNARKHAKNRVILKLDFSDFFGSIIFPDLLTTIGAANFASVSPDEMPLLRQALFWRNPFTNRLCLAIGAPSSPFISNVVMERIDNSIYLACREFSVICTRYADDITLSGKSVEEVKGAEALVREIVAKTKRPKLTFNESKRGIFTLAGRRTVTGLVITPEAKISLGREQKRLISAALHRIQVKRDLSLSHLHKTRGWLAYAKSVEPTFYESMRRKYEDVVRLIKRMPRTIPMDEPPP
jgi:RNA-directed DNA polymerase